MKRSVLYGACLLALLAGCASAPQKPVTTAYAKSRTCLATGSRIPRTEADCAAWGQSYTDDDIYQTGHPGELGTALRLLDPVAH
jgi:hypothetical protein